MRSILLVILLQWFVIPAKYRNNSELFKYIIPNKDVIAWEAGYFDIQSGKTTISFCSNDSVILSKLPLLKSNTYINQYFTSVGYRDYLYYEDNYNNIHSINRPEDLLKFIGEIDNYQEAFFIATLYGYTNNIGLGKKYGKYKYKKGSYYFSVYKIKTLPGHLPVFRIGMFGKWHEIDAEHVLLKVNEDGEVFVLKGLFNKKELKLPLTDMYRFYGNPYK